jgi:hypothetical protein
MNVFKGIQGTTFSLPSWVRFKGNAEKWYFQIYQSKACFVMLVMVGNLQFGIVSQFQPSLWHALTMIEDLEILNF